MERALEPAARVFAGELERATQSYRHGGADCLLLPSGAAITLVYLVGAVTALSGDTRTAMTARVADPTGVFLVRATSREPETLTALAAVTPPAFLAVLGYAVIGRNGPSVHPVSVAPVDRGTRDRWLLRTADLTAARLDAVLARLRGDGDDPIIDAAIAAYRMTPETVEALGAMALRALDVLPTAGTLPSPSVLHELSSLLMERIEAGGRDGVTIDDLLVLAMGRGHSKSEVEEAISGLLEEGECYMPRRGLIRIA